MRVTGEADGPPLKVGAAVVDLVCGLLAATGVLAALRERERTGARPPRRGLADGRGADLAAQPGLGLGARPARCPRRRGNRHPSIVPYETYEAADRPFAVAVGNDRLFARLCEAVGLPELAADERFATNARARRARRRARRARSSAVFAHAAAPSTGSRSLRAAGVPAGPINDVAEACALAESLGLGAVVEVDGVPLPAPPLRLDGERPAVRLPPPRARRARRRHAGLAARP